MCVFSLFNASSSSSSYTSRKKYDDGEPLEFEIEKQTLVAQKSTKKKIKKNARTCALNPTP